MKLKYHDQRSEYIAWWLQEYMEKNDLININAVDATELLDNTDG
ncbi:MAG: hypothetical protein RJQ14_19975 [Marinoscillum sp.]